MENQIAVIHGSDVLKQMLQCRRSARAATVRPNKLAIGSILRNRGLDPLVMQVPDPSCPQDCECVFYP
jgi:hypothetical protein